MRRKIALFTVLMVFAGYACSHEKTKQDRLADCTCESISLEKNSAVDKVKGSWNWIETSYFSEKYGSSLKTPNNTGKIMTYTFQGDSLIITSAGEIIEKTRYEIGKLQEITQFQQDSTLIIRLLDRNNTNQVALLHFCGDSIILVNSFNNLGGNVKLRKEG